MDDRNRYIIEHWNRWQGEIDCDATQKCWNSEELVYLTKSTAKSLSSSGLQEGDMVLFLLSNTVAFPVMLVSTLMLRCNPLLLHVSTTIKEVEKVSKKMHIKWIVHDSIESLGRFQDTSYQKVTTFGFESLSVNLYSVPESNVDEKKPDCKGVILHTTSGTYGRPQICIRNQNVAIAEAANYTSTITAYNHVRIHVTTPLSHAYAYGFGLMSAIITHSELVLAPAFNPKKVLRREKETLSNILTIVPPMAKPLIHLKQADPAYRLPKIIFYAGTRCDQMDIKEMEQLFETTVYTIYGSTETGAITSNYGKNKKASGVGSALNNVCLEIRNKEKYSNPQKEAGEIFVKSSSMMQSYYHKASEEKIEYFSTGDIGYMDGEGNVHLIGRSKDIINVGGIKVDPVEIENVLLSYPGISDCAVYPGKSPSNDEIILAALVLDRPDSLLTDIKKFCFENLSSYKIPYTFCTVKEIPRTASGKCKKVHLPGFSSNLEINGLDNFDMMSN